MTTRTQTDDPNTDFAQYGRAADALAWMRRQEADHAARRESAVRQAVAQLVQCPRRVEGETVVITVPACVFAGLLELAGLLPPEGDGAE